MLPLVAKEFAGWTQVWAPAKVNLYLRVVGKRPDSYPHAAIAGLRHHFGKNGTNSFSPV